MFKRLKLVPLLLCVFMMVFSLPVLAGKGPFLGESAFDDFFNRFFEDFPKQKGFTIESVVYYLDEPKEARFRIVSIGLLPKEKGNQEYMVFLSSDPDTIIEKADIIYYYGYVSPEFGPKLEAETKIIKTAEGYPAVVTTIYFLESGSPIEIAVSVTVQDEGSLHGEDNWFCFRRTTRVKNIKIALPEGYAVIGCDYPIRVGYRLYLSNPKGEEIKFCISAGKIVKLFD